MLPDQNKEFKILLIEDNPGDQQLVSEYLDEEFPKVNLDIANNFKEAKIYLSDQTKTFKIVLLDLSLPDIDRPALLNETIELAPNTPIIILTGQDNTRMAIEALTLGYTDYLLKNDLNSTSLRKSITYAFERKHIDRQLQLSLKRYQNLFQLNPQPIWVVNKTTGAFLETNKSALDKYGYSTDELLNMKIQDIDENYDQEQLENHLTDGEILKNENLHLHKLKSGQKIQVKLYGNYIDYQGINAILLMAIDLTETESYIRQIEIQNQQLKEIAWEQSHLVRAPLSRMMGILNRLEQKYLNYINEIDEECSFLIKNALSSSHEIDEVIRSIVKKSNSRNK